MKKSNFKYLLLLAILYLGFISLGLPDQILGIAWVEMRQTFSKPLESAGILVAIITVFTIISSFLSGFFIKRFSTNSILIFCTFLTSFAIFGFTFSPSWWILLAFCIPYGLGAGTVDSALNNYAAKNLNARHMNWLHGSWGIGATLGPAVMTFALSHTQNWRVGYASIGAMLFILFVLFAITRTTWGNCQKAVEEENTENLDKNYEKGEWRDILKQGPILSMLFFFLYAGLEVGIGLWACSTMVDSRGFDAGLAGSLIVIYWSSLTVGRFLIGFITSKFSTRKIVSASLICSFLGLSLFLFHNFLLNAIGLIIYGLSISSLFPCMMTLTTERFGLKTADILCGYQVGFAYTGVAILPPLIGVIISKTSLELLTPIVLGLILIMIFFDFALNKNYPPKQNSEISNEFQGNI